MNLKTGNNSEPARRAIKIGLRSWIKSERKIMYSKRDICNNYLYFIQSELNLRLHRLEFEIMDHNTRESINNIIHRKYINQNRKLCKLIKDKDRVNNNPRQISDHVFYDKFKNFTDIEFNLREINLLNKGFNYNLYLPKRERDFERLGVESEIILNRISNIFNINTIGKKYEIKNFLNYSKKTSLENNYNILKKNKFIIDSIVKKIKNNDIILTKADKGNTIIAINRMDYVEKTMEFLNPTKFTQIGFDLTTKFQSDVKETLKNSILFSEEECLRLVCMNPQVPRLYSLIKLHKQNNPIRPIVSFINSPSYKLSKMIISILNKYLNFKSKFSIKNSIELSKKISTIKIPNNSILLSFDVVNLFPNIDPLEVKELIERLLFGKRINPLIIKDIMQLLDTVLSQNYFEFDQKLFVSKDGLIMGSPLSPILSEIFMDDLESKISNIEFFDKFKFWFRYVDDIFACFTGSKRQLDVFFNNINKIHKNIKFTLEKEIENSLNFLDLSITKRKINSFESDLILGIFHKPTQTDTVIHYNSCHPHTQKMASFNCYIHRLLSIPMPCENYTKELNIIKQLAINNGYSLELIDRLLKNKNERMAIKIIYPYSDQEKRFYFSFTFMGQYSSVIYDIIKKLNPNIFLSFRTDKKLSSFVKNNKNLNRINKFDSKSGVYKLNCGSCNKVYVGQTGRKFEKRIREHLYEFNIRGDNSNYAKHLNEESHVFDGEYEVLHICQKGSLLNALESLEINRLKNSGCLLNNQLDLNNSPLLNLF